MNNSLTRGQRLPRWLVLFSILTILILPTARAGATAATPDQTVPLDLAAMALTPADLEPVGLTGFELASVDADSSGWRTLGDAAAGSIAGNFAMTLSPIELLNFDLAQAGWQRQYRRVLAQPNPADPEYVNFSVRSEVAEYADAAGPDDALTLLMIGGSVESSGTLPIGDRLVVRSDLLPNDGARVVVAFRDGNLLGSVEVIRYASVETPAVSAALQLARQLQIRIDDQLTRQGPGLAATALRLSTLAAPAEFEGYDRRDGETFIRFGESEEELADRDAAYDEAMDVYQLEQLVAPASTDAVVPYYVDRLYRFADATAAKNLLDQMPQRLAEDTANSGGKFSAELIENATSFGDRSLTFAIQVEHDGGTSTGYRTYIQVGSDVARIQLDSSFGPPIEAIEALATAQTACLEAGSCLAAEQPPVSLPGIDCPPTHVGINLESTVSSDISPVPVLGVDPARTGAQPEPGPSGGLQEHWYVDMQGGISHGPVISDGVAFIGSSVTTDSSESDYLYAIDLATREPKWCAPTDDAIAEPSVDGGLVFTETSAITGEHYQTSVVALDAATGLEQWQLPIGLSVESYSAAVAATNGTVFVTTGQGAVYALDEQSGNPRWLVQIDDAENMSELQLNYPEISDGIVYVSGGTVRSALSADTGEELWSVETDDSDEILGTPSVANGLVFAGGKYAIYAVDAQTGDEVWVTDVDGPDSAQLAVANGVVYATSGHDFDNTSVAYLAAFEADTGNQIWRLDVEGFVSAPSVAGDVLYVGTTDVLDESLASGNLVAISTVDGSVLRNVLIDGKVTAPIVTGGYVFIGDAVPGEDLEGTLYVIGGDTAPADDIPILDRKSG